MRGLSFKENTMTKDERKRLSQKRRQAQIEAYIKAESVALGKLESIKAACDRLIDKIVEKRGKLYEAAKTGGAFIVGEELRDAQGILGDAHDVISKLTIMDRTAPALAEKEDAR